MDPTDGRPYLGLSRIAQRRGDLERARGLLREGIARSTGGYVVVRGPGKVAVVEGGGGGRGGGKKKRRNKRDGGNGSEKNAKIVDGDRSDAGLRRRRDPSSGRYPTSVRTPSSFRPWARSSRSSGTCPRPRSFTSRHCAAGRRTRLPGSRWRSSARGSCGGDRPPDGCATGPPSGS